MTAKNEIVLAGGNYQIAGNFDEIKGILSESLGGEALSPQDLDQIKVPSGGGTSWEIETVAGPDSVKELNGIIVASQVQRVYWAEAFSGGNTPPDCVSTDGITGHGSPGGKCAECPMAEFGSSDNNRSQACQQRRMLFFVEECDILPKVISVPPSSLKAARQYLVRLAGQRMLPYGVVTRLTLEKDKNADGIAFSKMVFQAGAPVDPEVIPAVRGYVRQMKPALTAVATQVATEAADEDVAF